MLLNFEREDRLLLFEALQLKERIARRDSANKKLPEGLRAQAKKDLERCQYIMARLEGIKK